MNPLDLLIDLHKDGNRQGPGSDFHTRLALQFTDVATRPTPQIADIGCGTGASTLVLAGETTGTIAAVDLSAVLLQQLSGRMTRAGFSHRVSPVEASMDQLPFQPGSFDLIWSEGAIYQMGFREGLAAWKPFLKPDGWLAVSDICWITGSRPPEIDRFWSAAYQQMKTVSDKVREIEQAGYTPAAHFILPPSCWMEEYYLPTRDRIPGFLNRHHHSEAAQAVAGEDQQERELFIRYQAFYSYGFFVMQNRE